MKKTCSICGKVEDMLSWVSTCSFCRREQYFRDIKNQIQSGEADRTDSEDEIICPYCGEVQDYDSEYVSHAHKYGEDEVECNDCGRTFFLTVYTLYHYDTERIAENDE